MDIAMSATVAGVLVGLAILLFAAIVSNRIPGESNAGRWWVSTYVLMGIGTSLLLGIPSLLMRTDLARYASEPARLVGEGLAVSLLAALLWPLVWGILILWNWSATWGVMMTVLFGATFGAAFVAHLIAWRTEK